MNGEWEVFQMDLADLLKAPKPLNNDQEIDAAFDRFKEHVELERALGRTSSATTRLRSESSNEPLEKRERAIAAKTVKNANGSTCEFDSAGNLLRCYAKGVSPEAFHDLVNPEHIVAKGGCRCRD
jgi:hypothetical protein